MSITYKYNLFSPKLMTIYLNVLLFCTPSWDISLTDIYQYYYYYCHYKLYLGTACSTNGGAEDCTSILVGKPEVNRPLRRPRRRWVHNIKIDLREIGWDGMDWIDLAQDKNQWTSGICGSYSEVLRNFVVFFRS
jgi:hypothetical protein